MNVKNQNAIFNIFKMEKYLMFNYKKIKIMKNDERKQLF